MHEIGMLYSAAETAAEYADSNGFDAVNVISLELGELAGVIPNVFTEYFDYVKVQFPKLQSAKMELKLVPGEAVCDDCGSMYNVMKAEGKCPRCHSRNKTIISGRDVRLMSIA